MRDYEIKFKRHFPVIRVVKRRNNSKIHDNFLTEEEILTSRIEEWTIAHLLLCLLLMNEYHIVAISENFSQQFIAHLIPFDKMKGD